jgi:hypothetical protein
MINLVILYTNLRNFSQLQFELKKTKIATICQYFLPDEPLDNNFNRQLKFISF